MTSEQNRSRRIEIEVNVSYDTSVAQMDWSDNFELVDNSGMYFYTKNREHDGITVGELKRVKSDSKSTLHMSLYMQCRELMLEDENIDGVIIKALQQMDIEELYWHVNEFYTDSTRYELKDVEMLAKEYEIEIGLDKYEKINIVGNSQGEAATILVLKEDMFNGIGTVFKNLFYDTPVYAVVTIDGEETCLGCELNNQYEWDKEEIIEVINKWDDLSEYTRERIISMLPDEPGQ